MENSRAIKGMLFGLVSILTISGLWAGGTTESNTIKKPEVIRITTLKGPTGLGMLDLIENPYLTLADGSKIKLAIEIAGGPEILDARLLGKQVEAVTIPVNQAARLYTKGVDLKLAAVNVWGVLYVLSADPAIKSWQSIKGTLIMSSGKGSTTDVAFRELAHRNGLSDSDLNIDYSLGHVELMQLAAAGKANVVLLPEPFVTRVLQKNAKMNIVIDLQKEWKKSFGSLEQAQGGLVLSADFVKNYPEVAKALIKAYEDSCRRLLQAADAPERIAKQDFGLDAASARESLPRLNLRFVHARDAKDSIQNYLNVLFQANPASIGGALPDNGFYYP